jgi:hypothetical protein
MLVERSMDPGWLSNAYLLADEEGGTAVYVDTGAPLEPLLEAAERWRVEPEYILRTHGHQDHVVHEPTLGLSVITRAFEAGGLHIEALPTPGHAEDHLAFVVNGELCFSGDILFKDAVGGGSDVPAIRSSVMQLMELPPETRVHFWRGIEPGGEERGRVGIENVTILVDSPDYDGKGKLLVRFDDGREAILGGSRVER